MSLADELSKLENLRRRSVLSQAEFDKAKATILAGGASASVVPTNERLAIQLAEVRYLNELTRIDREWEIDREQFLISTKHGRHPPTPDAGFIGALLIGVFGVIWTLMSFFLSAFFTASAGGTFRPTACVFPLFGVGLTIIGVWWWINAQRKALKYQEALAAYQHRRADVRLERFFDGQPEPPQPRDERYT